MSSTAIDGHTSVTDPGQEEFYRRHEQVLFRSALMRCRNWQTAEDLVHEVFVRLFRKWHSLTKPVTYAYAAKVLKNCFIDSLRRRGARVSEVSGDVDQLVSPDALASPGLSGRDVEVREAVRSLPERQRDVVYYVYYEGLPLAETAKVMGLDPRTIHNYHSLAKKRLAISLAHLTSSVKDSRDER